jgi:flagellar motor switch protein FliG
VPTELPLDEPPALPEQTPEHVSGPRKAAVLIATLGPELASKVVQQLDDEEIESLSVQMTQLDSVGKRTAESVLTELALATQEQAGIAGGMDMTRDVLEKALGGERAGELMGRISGSSEMRPFEFLRRTPPEKIAALLHGESAQTVAVVVANLHSGLAAQVLARLPDDERPSVALRIARMGPTSSEVLHQVEELVRRRLTASVQREYASAGGTTALAEILGHSDRATERAVLDHLGGHDEELAEEVRSKLFVFEDLVKLDDRAAQQVLREADQKDLVLAIRGANDEVKEFLMSNMSERGAEMLKEELEVQQPQRKSDIDAAQGRIVAVVRRLEESGTIILTGTGGEDEDEVL